MSRILVVEDDPAILRGLTDNLRFDGHDVASVGDGYSAYKRIREQPAFDLVLLDVMLPAMSGFDVCRRARADGVQTPIIMLTARGEESDRVLGLDVGADDYVTKPFAVRELLARVRAVLRRTQPSSGALDAVRTEGLAIDFRSYEARRDGEPLALTRKEFGVLRYLASRAGEVIRRDELLGQVWGYESDVSTRTVDNHIASLRQKLEMDPRSPRHLLTVHGVGYKWVP